MTGRAVEAALELERMLPLVLAGSGPRWLGAVADLAVVAVATGNTAAAEHLDAVLWPYRGQLVIWAGANTSRARSATTWACSPRSWAAPMTPHSCSAKQSPWRNGSVRFRGWR